MVHPHRTTAGVVAALALTAGSASTASADPAPLASAEAAIAATHDGTAVRPNPDEQTVGPLPPPTQLTQAQVTALADLQRAAVQAGLHPGVFGRNPSRGSSTGSTVALRTVPDRGFDWGDAGIGAGASLVLLGVGLAGARVATTSRTRRIREKRTMAAG
jgi:hypothetical protein